MQDLKGSPDELMKDWSLSGLKGCLLCSNLDQLCDLPGQAETTKEGISNIRMVLSS